MLVLNQLKKKNRIGKNCGHVVLKFPRHSMCHDCSVSIPQSQYGRMSCSRWSHVIFMVVLDIIGREVLRSLNFEKCYKH